VSPTLTSVPSWTADLHLVPRSDVHSRERNLGASGAAAGCYAHLATVETNLPVALTVFVGRKLELAEVGGLLFQDRIVTLCGPGGCGKTRLAVEAARLQLAAHPDGTSFVDLSAVASPGFVVGAVATATGLGAASVPDLASLVRRLSDQTALLVLDNCEHLLGEAAAVAEALAHGCPRLRILATSREPLGTEGERVYRVAGLPEADAVRFFVNRAQLADAAFRMDETSAVTVAAICERLDGLPLAVELAAAQASSLAPADMLERLDHRFRLLVDGRSAVTRHRSISAAVEWSEALLTDAERVLYRRLGVFVGGFSLEAAEAVASGPDLPSEEVMPLLRRLVERSLVQFERDYGRGRYRLLETLREHALERLVQADELQALRDAHARYFAELTRRHHQRLFDDDSTVPVMPKLVQELGNYRAALEHTHSAGSPVFAKLASSMYGVWQLTRVEEGRGWLETALADGSPDPETRYWLLWSLSLLTGMQGDLAAARRYSEEALAICEGRSDSLEASRVIANLGFYERMAGNVEASLGLAQRAVDLARETRQPGRRRALVVAVYYLAASLLMAGELERGLAAAEESVAMADDLGTPRVIRMARGVLVDAHWRRGDLEKALTLHRLNLAIGPVDPWRNVTDLARMAALLIAAGKPERGVRLAGAVEVNCERFGFDVRTAAASVGDLVAPTLEQGTRAVDRRTASLRAAGRRMSLEDAVAFAREDPQAAPQDVPISPREVEVARLVRQGLTDPQIAKRLFISKRTAEGHVESLRNKLGVGSRAEVAAWVAENLPTEQPAADSR
jgi:predicted ATPase/DNA-binding CsgD family transcriptional regulator